MSKFDSCLVSLNLRDAVPADALRATAKQYQEQRGMDPSAAMLRAVEDQLQLAQMEEAGIIRTVRGEWEAQGGAKKVPELAPAQSAQDRPLAAAGLTSYRYKGRYGWVMIGAKDHADALKEANRSLESEKAEIGNLQVWDGSAYVPAEPVAAEQPAEPKPAPADTAPAPTKKPKQETMPRQDFESTGGVGLISAVKERYSDKFGVSWSSTDIASADTMEEAAAIAKAVAESGADNIRAMREVAASAKTPPTEEVAALASVPAPVRTDRIGDQHKARDAAAESAPAPEDYRGFTDGKAPMLRARIEKALAVQMGFDGRFATRKAEIERRVAAGARVEAHAKDGRRLFSEGGSFVSESDITKTAMDYAEHLIAQRDAEAAPNSKAPALQARDKKIAEQPAPKLKNYGWDAVKLSQAYDLPQLEELRQQVMVEHANERTPEGRYLEGGQPTIHLYDKKGRTKLDKLAMAVTYKLKERGTEDGDLRASMPSQKTYSQRELEDMDTDDLDRMAFGVADGEIVTLSPDQINLQYDDVENAQFKFDTMGGMKWARSVDLSEPVEVEVHDDGKFYLADGHHRWFAAGKTGKRLQAEVTIKGNPVRKILADQEARGDSDLRYSLTDTRTIEVDGVRRPIRNSLGELVAPDFMGQIEFWKNYTGPVDEKGRPIVEPGEDTRAAGDSIASDIDGQVAQAIKDGTTVDKLLALIESESSDAAQRDLAAALRRQNLKTTIEFGTPQGQYASGDAEQANGAYRQSDDTAFVGREIGAVQTALHELTHAATLRALGRGGLAARQIKELHKYVAAMPSFEGYYGITDPEEFITEALTSPSFRQQLADTPAPGNKLSIWQRLVGIVRMLLGMPAARENVLERVMAITPDLMAENRATGPIGESGVRASAQWASEAFRKWFGKSAVTNPDGTPRVVYHGTVHGDIEQFRTGWASVTDAGGQNFYFTDSAKNASTYAERGRAPKDGGRAVYPVYLSLQNPYVFDNTGRNSTWAQIDFFGDNKLSGPMLEAYAKMKHAIPEQYHKYAETVLTMHELAEVAKKAGHDGVILKNISDQGSAKAPKRTDTIIAFKPEQIKSATGNSGTFDPNNADIRASMPNRMADAIGNGLQAATLTDLPKMAANRLKDFRNVGLQFLGRRQLVDLYADQFKAGGRESTLARYSDLMQQMDADKNEAGAEADGIADRWGKLQDADKLADLMHDSTLAQIDPTKDYIAGDDRTAHQALQARLAALSPDARAIYAEARDAYHKHWMKVRAEIRNRIERAMPDNARRAKLLEKMDATFYEKVKGVYFPLARFGDYVVSVTDKNGTRLSVNFAETTNEAEALRRELLRKFPAADGHVVSKITKKKEFNAGRDAVSRGFMQELFGVLDQYEDSAELQDDINQLYLQSMPDLSWTKHGIHRKGTPGFSQDARRAFAQNLFHGARYLAKLRYGDRLADFLDEMQDHVDAQASNADYDSVRAQQVVDEMNKRHDAYMNPQGNSLSNALTSVGFLFYLGLSPASAVVNLTQTPLVTLPMLAAKHGFAKASGALLAAAKQTAGAKNDISKVLRGDELRAYQQAVDAGVIDVSMAHDLAGIASGDDTKAHGKLRPVMKWASFMFHHGEKFNRQASLLAAYRLAREGGAGHDAAYKAAVEDVYASHFDYSAGNRARVMQGPVARVVLLFKQYAQNMIYTLARNAVLAAKGDKVALRTLSGLLLSHAMAAGVLGLPIVGTLLSAATLIGGDDDEPWDAKVALRNYIADLIGQKPAEVMMHGFSRLTPFDISGRVGLDKLILPDVQEGLEGARAAESWMTAALGPVAGIGLSAAKGAANIAQGNYLRGLEDMMPVSVRNPIKALRLHSEGVKDKTGIPILDDTSAIEEIGQLIGFSPSRSREAMEGKSAVYRAERVLTDRRQALVEQWAHARMADDEEGAAEVWEAVQRFNAKNPSRRITMPALVQSLRNRNKRIREAEDGVYLPKKHQDVRDLGRFATAGD